MPFVERVYIPSPDPPIFDRQLITIAKLLIGPIATIPSQLEYLLIHGLPPYAIYQEVKEVGVVYHTYWEYFEALVDFTVMHLYDAPRPTILNLIQMRIEEREAEARRERAEVQRQLHAQHRRRTQPRRQRGNNGGDVTMA